MWGGHSWRQPAFSPASGGAGLNIVWLAEWTDVENKDCNCQPQASRLFRWQNKSRLKSGCRHECPPHTDYTIQEIALILNPGNWMLAGFHHARIFASHVLELDGRVVDRKSIAQHSFDSL